MSGAGHHYRSAGIKADALDDPSPLVTPPTARVFQLFTERPDSDVPTVGFRGYLQFTTPAANTAEIETWVKNDNDGTWLRASVPTLTGVGHRLVFIQDDVGDATIFIRITNVTGGNPIEVFLEEA